MCHYLRFFAKFQTRFVAVGSISSMCFFCGQIFESSVNKPGPAQVGAISKAQK